MADRGKEVDKVGIKDITLPAGSLDGLLEDKTCGIMLCGIVRLGNAEGRTVRPSAGQIVFVIELTAGLKVGISELISKVAEGDGV